MDFRVQWVQIERLWIDRILVPHDQIRPRLRRRIGHNAHSITGAVGAVVS